MCMKGVGVLEARIVRVMDDGSEWTANEIRERVGCPQQEVRGMLVRLCERGFVEIYRPTDPRQRNVYRLIGEHPARRHVS